MKLKALQVFNVGIVPSDFKIASQSSLCNYRPASLISVFSKLLEKLVYNRLIKFLENQYGFRKFHSTDHAILCIIDDRSCSCGTSPLLLLGPLQSQFKIL